MAEDIGELAVKIAMEDSSFQQGMQNLKRSMGVIDSSFKESISGLKNWGSSIDGLKANAQALSKKINVQKQVVQQYQEQLQKSKDSLQANSEKMMELKSKVEAAKSAWEESKTSLGANDEATLKLKKDFEDLNKQYVDQESKVRNNTKSIDAYTIQVNNANGKLKNMESDLSDVSKQLDEANKKQSLFGQATDKLGLNAENLKTAFGAVGIAAGTNQSLSDAASLVADAYHGKMRALASLGIVNQQEIKNNTAAQKVEQLQTDMENKIKEKYGETAAATKLLR